MSTAVNILFLICFCYVLFPVYFVYFLHPNPDICVDFVVLYTFKGIWENKSPILCKYRRDIVNQVTAWCMYSYLYVHLLFLFYTECSGVYNFSLK